MFKYFSGMIIEDVYGIESGKESLMPVLAGTATALLTLGNY